MAANNIASLDVRVRRAQGISYADAVRLNDGLPLQTRGSKAARYQAQRKAAVKRGIGWEISFSEWVSIWTESGKWLLRGVGRGKYCMARNGDIGPYKIGNVAITPNEQNASEALKKQRPHNPRTGEGCGYTKACKNRLKPYQSTFRGRLLGHFATSDEAISAYQTAAAQALQGGI